MNKASARVTSKSQLVLPRAVREQLGVGPGDTLVFRFGADGVFVEKAATQDDPFATFEEWSSAADDEAYRDL
jgi:AbrB family looped-hinge helix DNA binding protein